MVRMPFVLCFCQSRTEFSLANMACQPSNCLSLLHMSCHCTGYPGNFRSAYCCLSCWFWFRDSIMLFLLRSLSESCILQRVHTAMRRMLMIKSPLGCLQAVSSHASPQETLQRSISTLGLFCSKKKKPCLQTRVHCHGAKKSAPEQKYVPSAGQSTHLQPYWRLLNKISINITHMCWNLSE